MPGGITAGTGAPLLVVGTDHRTSPAAWRDRFALMEMDLAAELDRLRARGFPAAVLLATCDRIEVVTVGADANSARLAVAEHLAERVGVTAATVEAALYVHVGLSALRHLFAVASALDSIVVGEPHILGQLRAAHRVASEAGMVSGVLESALQAAFATARRVRRETGIADRPVSIAAAAVELAREIQGDLQRATALLIGSGEMGEFMVDQLRRAGLGRVLVAGPEPFAERIAHRLACTLLPFPVPDGALAEADIVVTAVASGRRILTAADMSAALRARRRRPVFVIDTAIPFDVEPSVNDLDGAFLYTLDDLEGAAMTGRETREAASAAAWGLLDSELASFERRQAERAAVPTVTRLRAHFEAARAAVLRDQPGLDAEAATRLLVNRLLHAPSETLRALAASAGDAAAEEVLVRRLFRLESDDGDETP